MTDRVFFSDLRGLVADMKVWILNGSVHTGKTTFLTRWCERVRRDEGNKTLFGVLSGPDDEEGRRQVTLLPSEECRRLQCSPKESEELQKQRDSGKEGVRETVTVGAYTFFSDIMQWTCDNLLRLAEDACKIAQESADKNFFFILDEVGPLEIVRGMGFEPFVSELFRGEHFSDLRKLSNFNIIVVVRDTMVNRFSAKYLAGASEPIQTANFDPQCPIWLAYSEGIDPQFPYIPESK